MSPIHRAARRRTILILAGIVALGLAACGGGDDAPTADATTEQTAADASSYVEAGNSLCEDTGVAIEAAFPDFEGEPTIEQVMELGANLQPVMQDWRDGVAALDPPADLAARHQALLDELDESIATLELMATTQDGAQAALDAGGPPLDAPSTAANAIFPACPAGDE